jgi:hypothetical protein
VSYLYIRLRSDLKKFVKANLQRAFSSPTLSRPKSLPLGIIVREPEAYVITWRKYCLSSLR